MPSPPAGCTWASDAHPEGRQSRVDPPASSGRVLALLIMSELRLSFGIMPVKKTNLVAENGGSSKRPPRCVLPALWDGQTV
jgi:hypothetical protein